MDAKGLTQLGMSITWKTLSLISNLNLTTIGFSELKMILSLALLVGSYLTEEG